MTPGATLDVAGVINGRSFSIPTTGKTAQWVLVGTFTAGQSGETIRITAYIHQGYNAFNSQDSTYFINFKTSNTSATDANGFAGNGSYYAVGFNNSIPPGDIAWVGNAAGGSATSYNLYMFLPSYTYGSHYTVSVDSHASWANVGTIGAAAPGVASSTVLIPNAEFDLPYGNVGIGTTNPGAVPPSGYVAGTPILEVKGDVVLTKGSGGSITFQDGTTQSTAYTGVTCTGADYAEAIDVTGDRTKYEPGDVLVIDPSVPGKFLKADLAYSTLVAGIYSTKPGFVGRKQPSTPETSATEVPMAMVGRVPTKVSAENGPINVGDLLVSSSTVGYAMKGTDRSQMLGAVIGKALGSLASGMGVIEVLVTLQ
jgi:hypothetical protein